MASLFKQTRFLNAIPVLLKTAKEFTQYNVIDTKELIDEIPVCKRIIVCDKCGEFEDIKIHSDDKENYIECLTCGAKEYGKKI